MKLLPRVRSFFQHIRQGTPDPTRSWLSMLAVGAIALAGIIVWNVWLFDRVASGGVIGTAATSTVPVFDRATLNMIHTIFENRETEELKYQTGTYHFADPSQ